MDLTAKGVSEAEEAGVCIQAAGLRFDEAHTSYLKRSTRTLCMALHASDHHHIPIYNTWRLNERHYGALTGMSKNEAKVSLGDEQLQRFRRGFDVKPPSMTESHPFYRHIYGHDKYASCLGEIPRGESLRDCYHRVVPYWDGHLLPRILASTRIIVSAHNNVIRCLVRHIDNLDYDSLAQLEIPTGKPLVYTLDRNGHAVGEPDDLGFRGKLLEVTDEERCAARSDPTDHIVVNVDTIAPLT